MFYRIRENKIYDYADYQYEKDCLFTNLCTMNEYIENPDKFIIACDSDNSERLELNPDWREILTEKKKKEFYKNFFNTSLGWIRRSVTMKDGSIKDFLSDLLLPIKAGIELGQNVAVITYRTPDFSVEPDNTYMKSLQEIKFATMDFVQECLMQTVQDFGLENGGSDGV